MENVKWIINFHDEKPSGQVVLVDKSDQDITRKKIKKSELTEELEIVLEKHGIAISSIIGNDYYLELIPMRIKKVSYTAPLYRKTANGEYYMICAKHTRNAYIPTDFEDIHTEYAKCMDELGIE